MKYDIKVLRDLVLGDGYLVQPCGLNGGSGFRCCQGIEQWRWLSYKSKILIDLGFNLTRAEYHDKRRTSVTQVIYTQTNQEFRRLYNRWYMMNSKGKMQKRFELMLNECPFDIESLMMLYLDNGHSEIRKTVIRYNTKKKIDVNPFFDNLSICCSYHDSNVLAEKINNLGFICRANRPFELRSRITIFKVEEKRKFLDCLKNYCEERNLGSTFSYKYNLPVSCAIND